MDVTWQKALQLSASLISHQPKFGVSDYFVSLSSWIANLGVVPLFLFIAFLFFPAFTRRLERLFFVIRVKDTIYYSLSLFQFIKRHFIPVTISLVKTVFPIIFLTSYCIASSESSPQNEVRLILSRGEHKELKISDLDHFTITNPEIIGHTLKHRKTSLLIKGKRLGMAELIIWSKKKGKRVYRIYVLSKTKALERFHIGKIMEDLGLEVDVSGPILKITGEIKSHSNYILYQKTKNKNLKLFHTNITLKETLKKNILGEIYRHLFLEYRDQCRCSYENEIFLCRYPSELGPGKQLKSYLKDQYGVQFMALESSHGTQNYKIKIKLFEIEANNAKDLNIGINHIHSPLKDFFTKGADSILSSNFVRLNKTGLRISTLAEPIATIRKGSPLELKIGSELPIGRVKKSLQLKFIGLKISLSLEQVGSKYIIHYKTSLSKSLGESSFSNQESSSSLSIKLNSSINLFDIYFQADNTTSSSLPILGKIPLIGGLFTHKNTSQVTKKLTAIILLEKMK